MTITYLTKPDKTLEADNWIISIYNDTNTAICQRIGSKVCYIIRNSTDITVHLPKHVIKVLEKEGFLEKWREHKLEQILKTLSEISKKLEKMRETQCLK